MGGETYRGGWSNQQCWWTTAQVDLIPGTGTEIPFNQTLLYVEEWKPTWCHLLFYFNYYALNMFRTLICPSSGACDFVDELPHRSSCSVKTDVLAISVPLRCVVVCLVWCVLSPCCNWWVCFNWFWPLYIMLLWPLCSFVCGIFHCLFGMVTKA